MIKKSSEKVLYISIVIFIALLEMITVIINNNMTSFFILNIFIILLIGFVIILKRPIVYFYLFIPLYCILPDYFRIGKFPVYTVMIIGLIFIYLYSKKFANTKINFCELFRERKYISLFIFYILIEMFSYIIHYEIITMIRFVLEKVVVLMVLYSFIDSRKKFDKVIDLIIIATFILTIFGVIEYLTEFNIFSLVENYYYPNLTFGSQAYVRFGKVRVEQSFNHSIIYCVYLIFVSSLVFYKTQQQNKSNMKYKVAMTMIVINAVLTMSRAPLILFFVNLFFLLFLIEKKKRIKIIKNITLCIPFVIIFILITGIGKDVIMQSWYMILALFDEKYRVLISTEFGGNSEPFHYRLGLYSIVYNQVKDSIFYGIPEGVSRTFSYVNPSGYIIEASSVDNNYLVLLQNYGILGVVNFIVFYFGNIVFSLKRLKITNYMLMSKNKILNFNYIFIITMVLYLINLLSVAQMHEIRMVIVFIVLMLSYNKIIKKESRQVKR